MIGVDTNVLVRLLVQDDPAQNALARDFFARRDAGDPAYIGSVVLAEAIWLLRSRMGFARDAVEDVVRGLLDSDDFVIEAAPRLRELLAQPASDRAQVADHLIAWAAETAGCTRIVTFDRQAARLVPAMELLA